MNKLYDYDYKLRGYHHDNNERDKDMQRRRSNTVGGGIRAQRLSYDRNDYYKHHQGHHHHGHHKSHYQDYHQDYYQDLHQDHNYDHNQGRSQDHHRSHHQDHQSNHYQPRAQAQLFPRQQRQSQLQHNPGMSVCIDRLLQQSNHSNKSSPRPRSRLFKECNSPTPKNSKNENYPPQNRYDDLHYHHLDDHTLMGERFQPLDDIQARNPYDENYHLEQPYSSQYHYHHQQSKSNNKHQNPCVFRNRDHRRDNNSYSNPKHENGFPPNHHHYDYEQQQQSIMPTQVSNLSQHYYNQHSVGSGQIPSFGADYRFSAAVATKRNHLKVDASAMGNPKHTVRQMQMENRIKIKRTDEAGQGRYQRRRLHTQGDLITDKSVQMMRVDQRMIDLKDQRKSYHEHGRDRDRDQGQNDYHHRQRNSYAHPHLHAPRPNELLQSVDQIRAQNISKINVKIKNILSTLDLEQNREGQRQSYEYRCGYGQKYRQKQTAHRPATHLLYYSPNKYEEYLANAQDDALLKNTQSPLLDKYDKKPHQNLNQNQNINQTQTQTQNQRFQFQPPSTPSHRNHHIAPLSNRYNQQKLSPSHSRSPKRHYSPRLAQALDYSGRRHGHQHLATSDINNLNNVQECITQIYDQSSLNNTLLTMNQQRQQQQKLMTSSSYILGTDQDNQNQDYCRNGNNGGGSGFAKPLLQSKLNKISRQKLRQSPTLSMLNAQQHFQNQHQEHHHHVIDNDTFNNNNGNNQNYDFIDHDRDQDVDYDRDRNRVFDRDREGDIHYHQYQYDLHYQEYQQQQQRQNFCKNNRKRPQRSSSALLLTSTTAQNKTAKPENYFQPKVPPTDKNKNNNKNNKYQQQQQYNRPQQHYQPQNHHQSQKHHQPQQHHQPEQQNHQSQQHHQSHQHHHQRHKTTAAPQLQQLQTFDNIQGYNHQNYHQARYSPSDQPQVFISNKNSNNNRNNENHNPSRLPPQPPISNKKLTKIDNEYKASQQRANRIMQQLKAANNEIISKKNQGKRVRTGSLHVSRDIGEGTDNKPKQNQQEKTANNPNSKTRISKSILTSSSNSNNPISNTNKESRLSQQQSRLNISRSRSQISKVSTSTIIKGRNIDQEIAKIDQKRQSYEKLKNQVMGNAINPFQSLPQHQPPLLTELSSSTITTTTGAKSTITTIRQKEHSKINNPNNEPSQYLIRPVVITNDNNVKNNQFKDITIGVEVGVDDGDGDVNKYKQNNYQNNSFNDIENDENDDDQQENCDAEVKISDFQQVIMPRIELFEQKRNKSQKKVTSNQKVQTKITQTKTQAKTKTTKDIQFEQVTNKISSKIQKYNREKQLLQQRNQQQKKKSKSVQKQILKENQVDKKLDQRLLIKDTSTINTISNNKSVQNISIINKIDTKQNKNPLTKNHQLKADCHQTVKKKQKKQNVITAVQSLTTEQKRQQQKQQRSQQVIQASSSNVSQRYQNMLQQQTNNNYKQPQNKQQQQQIGIPRILRNRKKKNIQTNQKVTTNGKIPNSKRSNLHQKIIENHHRHRYRDNKQNQTTTTTTDINVVKSSSSLQNQKLPDTTNVVYQKQHQSNTPLTSSNKFNH